MTLSNNRRASFKEGDTVPINLDFLAASTVSPDECAVGAPLIQSSPKEIDLILR